MNFHRLSRSLGWPSCYHALALIASFAFHVAPLSAAERDHHPQAEVTSAGPVRQVPLEEDELATGNYLSVSPLGADIKPQVYAGTIGPDEIVMELYEGEYGVSGRFFYRKDRLDIGFDDISPYVDTGLDSDEPAEITADLILDVYAADSQMALVRTGTALSGWFTGNGGLRLPVSLSLRAADVADAGDAGTAFASFSDYQRQQLSGLKLVAGDARQDGARTLREWREPVSGISLFRIERGYPDPVLDKINAALTLYHWQRVSAWFDCDGKNGESGQEMSQLTSALINDDFVSLAWTNKVRCLASHAGTIVYNASTLKNGLTFDARTGKEVHLDDLLYLREGVPPKPATNAWYDYRLTIFPARIAALLDKGYPQPVPPTEDCQPYNHMRGWEWGTFAWYLTNDGLYLEKLDFLSCGEPEAWRTITWDHPLLHHKTRAPDKNAHQRPATLGFGQALFSSSDIARISLIVGGDGFPGLEITVKPQAIKRLEIETIRLLGTDFNIALGPQTVASPRLIEPITNGRFGLYGFLFLPELQALAGEIICSMQLSPQQFDPTNLAGSLPCEPE